MKYVAAFRWCQGVSLFSTQTGGRISHVGTSKVGFEAVACLFVHTKAAAPCMSSLVKRWQGGVTLSMRMRFQMKTALSSSTTRSYTSTLTDAHGRAAHGSSPLQAAYVGEICERACVNGGVGFALRG